METSLTFWCLAIVGVLLTGISKSGFAGGIGVIAVPLLSLSISPITAAALMLPLLIVMDFFSVKAWLGKQDTALLKLLLLPAIVGIGVGYLMFGSLNENHLKLMLGILSLAFALWGLFNGLDKFALKQKWAGRIFSGIAGFTSFVAHAGGPPVNMYLIPLKLPRETFLATSVMFFAAVNAVKLVPYIALNQFNADNLKVAAILIPIAWIGVRLGLVIQRYLNDKLFYRIILIMLLIIGAKLISDSL